MADLTKAQVVVMDLLGKGWRLYCPVWGVGELMSDTERRPVSRSTVAALLRLGVIEASGIGGQYVAAR